MYLFKRVNLHTLSLFLFPFAVQSPIKESLTCGQSSKTKFVAQRFSVSKTKILTDWLGDSSSASPIRFHANSPSSSNFQFLVSSRTMRLTSLRRTIDSYRVRRTTHESTWFFCKRSFPLLSAINHRDRNGEWRRSSSIIIVNDSKYSNRMANGFRF